MTPLLAKSPPVGRPALSLSQHLVDTERCATRIFAPDTRWGRAWRRFFRLDAADADRFLPNLAVAALFHDLGKANADFQRAVTTGGVKQRIRHEHLSALALCLPSVRTWLAPSPVVDVDTVTAAVLSHHFKATSEDGDYSWPPDDLALQIALLADDPAVLDTLDRIASVAAVGPPPRLPQEVLGAGPWLQATADAGRYWKQYGRRPYRALGPAVKAALIVSDSVASALVRVDEDIDTWIDTVAHAEPLTEADVRRHVIAPRQASVPGFKGLHGFQRAAAALPARALLLAPCGSGKTLAAWEWAATQARERQIGRVIFLYPTRGTATEGFRDYVAWSPDGALLHGHAPYELQGMRENPPDAWRGRAPAANAEAADRLYALGYWPKRHFSATVDQFLAFLEHGYPSTCLLPVLADAAVVVDEVHSFDPQLFDWFVRFLQAFDVPVLAMTATLPGDRLDRLREAGLRVYPSDAEQAELPDLRAEAEYPRYDVERVDGARAALDVALTAWEAGQRVLWVVNTVDRCQDLARALGSRGVPVLAYHSRFRLEDRRAAHTRTVAAFRRTVPPIQGDERAFAVTTQVCEMSLDLDADILITEIAPVTSLVQRCGRVLRNRHQRPAGTRGRVLVYTPEAHAPYERDVIAAAERFIDEIAAPGVSQTALAEALWRHVPPALRPGGEPAFLSSGYFAVPGNLRDIDERSVTCVLDTDLAEVEAAHKQRKPIDAWLVPVPRRLLPEGAGERSTTLPPWLRVAPSTPYSTTIGYQRSTG